MWNIHTVPYQINARIRDMRDEPRNRINLGNMIIYSITISIGFIIIYARHMVRTSLNYKCSPENNANKTQNETWLDIIQIFTIKVWLANNCCVTTIVIYLLAFRHESRSTWCRCQITIYFTKHKRRFYSIEYDW